MKKLPYAGPAGRPGEAWLSILVIALLAAAGIFFYHRHRTRHRPT